VQPGLLRWLEQLVPLLQLLRQHLSVHGDAGRGGHRQLPVHLRHARVCQHGVLPERPPVLHHDAGLLAAVSKRKSFRLGPRNARPEVVNGHGWKRA
jgi:hypothetical protein